MDDVLPRAVSVATPIQAPREATGVPVARRARAGLPLLVAVVFTAYVAGGLLVGAAALFAVSLRPQAVTSSVPDSIHTVLGALREGSPRDPTRSRLSPLFAALPDWEGKTPFSILLLGIDQRDDERAVGSDPGRTDTMMVLRVDPRAKTAGLIGFPRDLWVDIPGVGKGRINSAYTYGELRSGEGGGPTLAKQTMAANFGLDVDYYALVNFHGLEQIVDTLGGIVIDVERPIKDDEYPTEDYGVERLYVPAGPQFMDGHRALQYARSRHSENDFGRMRWQQRVLFAIRQRALQLNMLARAPALVSQSRSMVRTDLGPSELLRLAKLAQQVDTDQVHSLVIDGSLVHEANPRAGEYELLWDKERIRRAVSGLLAGLIPDQAARIAVLNGSGRPGLAADTAKLLLNLGYEVTRIDDADRGYPESVLEVPAGRRSLAEDLAATLRLAHWTARDMGASTDDEDVRLIVGRDFELPASTTAPIQPVPSAAALPNPGGH